MATLPHAQEVVMKSLANVSCQSQNTLGPPSAVDPDPWRKAARTLRFRDQGAH